MSTRKERINATWTKLFSVIAELQQQGQETPFDVLENVNSQLKYLNEEEQFVALCITNDSQVKWFVLQYLLVRLNNH